VKTFLQSVYIYGSYRKIKTGVPFFLDHPVYYCITSHWGQRNWDNQVSSHNHLYPFCCCNYCHSATPTNDLAIITTFDLCSWSIPGVTPKI